MSNSRLQDDLLAEFHEEKKLIANQLALFDPLATSLSKPAAQRLLHKGALIFFEIICYLIALGAIPACIFLDKIQPFYILASLRDRQAFKDQFGSGDVSLLYWSVIAIIAFIGILFYMIARLVRCIRLKNTVLALAAKHIKTLVGQHLHRKAAIDAIEQRHFSELPPMPAMSEPRDVLL